MNSEHTPIVNIAAYKFFELGNLVELRNELRELTRRQQLRGSILLSVEGINMFVAGTRAGIEHLLERVRQIPNLGHLDVKESYSREQPFNRMLVKIKREIIAFGVDGIEPARYTSQRLAARELKRWLDEGRPITLLDTRNDFEVEVGTFRNALAIGIEDFRDFPSAVSKLPDDLKQKPIVTFCTGGIRCEKATPFLEQAGFKHVYQLDGGILKYFEECGEAHYQGDCFVFDKRVALDPKLQECVTSSCFVCRKLLSPDDLNSPKFVEGQSCPHCYRTAEEAYADLLQMRHAAIRQAVTPLPGSVPYDNVRPISVPLRLDRFEVLDFLDAMQTHLSREDWKLACLSGRVTCRGQVVEPGRIVRSGERLFHCEPAVREPDVATGIGIIHEDDAIIVVSKPAPLPMHPCGRFHRNSLTYLLDQVYRPLRPRPVHRLDADTSGVVIFGKTREVARQVQPQFELGQVQKTYLARVHGHPEQSQFAANWAIGFEPGENGIRLPEENGMRARTEFQVLEKFPDGTSLLKVSPETGRTNQIRIHLWKLNYPIVGDPIYLQDQRLGQNNTLSMSDPRLCLHAAEITFTHPLTRQQEVYRAPVPEWL